MMADCRHTVEMATPHREEGTTKSPGHLASKTGRNAEEMEMECTGTGKSGESLEKTVQGMRTVPGTQAMGILKSGMDQCLDTKGNGCLQVV